MQARPARRLLVIGLVANEFAQPREVWKPHVPMYVLRSHRLLTGYTLSSHYAQSGWGSTLLLRPELAGVTVATIEPRPGCNVVG